MSTKQTHDELLRELTDKAKSLWGEARASELSAELERTVSQLEDVDQKLPKRDVEPGFYQ